MCKSIYENGVKIVHGNRDAFVNDKLPAFKRIFMAIRNYKFERDREQYFERPLANMLEETVNTNCGKTYKYFVMNAAPKFA